ncbi:hypothetical protein [Nocardioides sp. 503]|uniref:hypothetical protein n=1 Tax=Nocardioides sp. 503 TaxID=2508326 RepID=UPI00107043BC|nr:hypothetical protein [Nocardioides sp. 503]
MDTHASTPEQVTDDAIARAVRRHDATLRHWSGVNVLLERRTDLGGVVAMADLIHESVRWAA